MGGHGELLRQLGEGRALPRPALLAIDRDHQARELDRRGAAQDRHGLPDRGPRGRDVLDDQHAVAVLEAVPHQGATLPVVLGLLAVEAEGHVAASLGEGGRDRGDQRDALVRGAEEDVEALGEGPLDGVGVRVPELPQLGPRAVQPRVHEVGRLPPALGGEVPEGQDLDLEHEVDEGALVLLHGARMLAAGPRRREGVRPHASGGGPHEGCRRRSPDPAGGAVASPRLSSGAARWRSRSSRSDPGCCPGTRTGSSTSRRA